MDGLLAAYLPQDRRQALGARRGVEELTRQINRVYDALIGEVERSGGSVIGFAGDAITCWFRTLRNTCTAGADSAWQAPKEMRSVCSAT